MPERNYNTLTTLWHGEIERQLFAHKNELDFIASIDTMRYDQILATDSMQYDFDMGRDLWLMKGRFTVLQRDYLDLYQLEQFLKRCEEIGLGEAKRGVITQLFAKQHAMRDKKYRWGNCMLGWDFRGGHRYQRPVLTMHSRVSYIAYIGGLDLALSYVLAREIGERIGATPEDFQFRWFLSSSQFHGFKSLGAMYSLGYEDVLDDTEGYPSELFPTIKLCRRWHDVIVRDYKAGRPLEAEKYGPLKRIRRRYAEYKEGKRYSTPLEALSLTPLRLRG